MCLILQDTVNKRIGRRTEETPQNKDNGTRQPQNKIGERQS